MKLNFMTYEGHEEALNIPVAGFGVWSVESGTMLPLTRARIANFKLSIFGVMEDRKFPITHAAITEVDDGVATIGGYVTDPAFRGNGFGFWTLQHLAEIAPEYFDNLHTLEANVNSAGLSQFEALGFAVTGIRQPAAATGCNYLMQKQLVGQEVAA